MREIWLKTSFLCSLHFALPTSHCGSLFSIQGFRNSVKGVHVLSLRCMCANGNSTETSNCGANQACAVHEQDGPRFAWAAAWTGGTLPNIPAHRWEHQCHHRNIWWWRRSNGSDYGRSRHRKRWLRLWFTRMGVHSEAIRRNVLGEIRSPGNFTSDWPFFVDASMFFIFMGLWLFVQILHTTLLGTVGEWALLVDSSEVRKKDFEGGKGLVLTWRLDDCDFAQWCSLKKLLSVHLRELHVVCF